MNASFYAAHRRGRWCVPLPAHERPQRRHHIPSGMGLQATRCVCGAAKAGHLRLGAARGVTCRMAASRSDIETPVRSTWTKVETPPPIRNVAPGQLPPAAIVPSSNDLLAMLDVVEPVVAMHCFDHSIRGHSHLPDVRAAGLLPPRSSCRPNGLSASGWSPRIPSGTKRLPRFGIGGTPTAKRLTRNSAGWSRSWT